MLYSFDIWGWLSETDIAGRKTSVAPPDASIIPNGQKANFTGYSWVILPYSSPALDIVLPNLSSDARVLGQQISNHLDEIVRQRDYDDMKAAVTYALSSVPRYKAEGQSCLSWRDAVWVKFYEIMSEVEAGTIPLPNYDDLIVKLPAMEWPI